MNGNRFFTQMEKREMLERQEYMCGNCGDNLWGDHIGANQGHHILPVWAGGATEVDNGVVLCHSCHVLWDNMAVLGDFYPGGYELVDIQEEQVKDNIRYLQAYKTIALNNRNNNLTRRIKHYAVGD